MDFIHQIRGALGKIHRNRGYEKGRGTSGDYADTSIHLVGDRRRINWKDAPKLIVLKDFRPCTPDDIKVSQGQEVAEIYRESDWLYVMTKDGKEGFVPFFFCAEKLDQRCSITANYPAHNIPVDLSPSSKRNGKHLMRSRSDPLKKQEAKATPDQNARTTSLGATLADYNKSYPQPNSNTMEGYWASKNPFSFHKQPRGNEQLSQRMLNYSPKRIAVDASKVTSFVKIPLGRYRVLFTFTSFDENDVSVSKGEVITVLNMDDTDWYWVNTSDDIQGFVPSVYLQPPDNHFNIGMEMHI